MNFNLKQKLDRKVQVPVYLYSSTLEEIQKIADKEKLKLSHLLRHMINEFLDAYKKHLAEPK